MTLVQYGFRLFFPLAALSAASVVVLTVLGLTGTFVLPNPIGWHAHEMLFGFMGALLAGFFLTAVPNWTKRPRLHGAPLVAFAVLWLAGRGAVFAGQGWPPLAVAALDASFLVLLGLLIGGPIFGTRSTRNLAFPVLVWVLAGASFADHLEWAGHLTPTGAPRRVAMLTLVAVIIIFGGRIVPLFTRGALRRARAARGDDGPDPVRARTAFDTAVITASAALIPLTVWFDGTPIMAAGYALAAGLNLARMRGWASGHTLRDPLLLILHVGYAWIPLAFALAAVAQIDPGLVPLSAARHALTSGVLGTFALGMMSRVMRGHTGRPLVAPRAITVAYGLVTLAALVRVVGPIVAPAALVRTWHSAMGLWALAFMILFVVDLPIALAPRPDGKPG